MSQNAVRTDKINILALTRKVSQVGLLLLTAISMTSSSRDIYFHTPSGNQTKL